MTTTPSELPAIEVHALVKSYSKSSINAVDSISFSVQRGETFGLLGPNGAGKTTTIGILTTSVRSTSGSARIMGIDVATDPMSTKRRIAVVPQRSNLDMSLRVRELLTFHASYHGVPHAERNTRADTLLNEFGLAQRGKEMLKRYSGGMTQRVMLARALMHTPDVLFLDEPTNNLDPQTRLFLWDRIHTLHEQGVTILLTTHDMEEADRLCQRIAIMDQGRILVADTPAELKKLIPGGSTLELHVRIPELVSIQPAHTDIPVTVVTNIQSVLAALPGITKVEKLSATGEERQQSAIQKFRLYAEDAGALVVKAAQCIEDAGGEVRDLHLAYPSLEDVFIYLTGRQIR
jgi:ABC-2 type transport system ATP-binding protein